ncbi:MAG: hypothetical protein P9L93_06930 [Candidatus Gorgyraea atricola]|nr:hypothetical protein [Candidatus Gorgyraea atricola]
MIDEFYREIIKRLDIHFFVETGTDMGETVAEVARWFSEMDSRFGKISDYAVTGARYYSLNSKLIKYPIFEDVSESQFNLFSVDIDRHSFESARELFKTNKNIKLFHGDSAKFLQKCIDEGIFKSSKTIFFLDAHWGKYWPLRDELKQALKLEKSVIIIDDFFVPRRSSKHRPHGDFGFDFYYGRILCWGYIYDLFYNVDVRVYYPTHSNKYGRGFVVLFKGYSSEELSFLKSMPLEYFDKDNPLHRKPVSLSLLAYFDFYYFVRRIVPLSLLRRAIRMFQKIVH